MSLINPMLSSLSSLDTLLPAEIRKTLQKENWDEYQKETENKLAMHDDDWRDQLTTIIKSHNSTETNNQFFPFGKPPLWPLPTHINILKRVVKEISKVYKNEPTRRMEEQLDDEDVNPDSIDIETTDAVSVIKESDRFNEIVGGDYNIMMQKVNSLVNTVNMVIVVVLPDESEETGLRFDLLTPDMFIPIQHPDNPKELIGLIYTVASTDTNSDLSTVVKERIIFMGTKDQEPFIAEVDNNDQSEIEKEPYPFTYQGEKYLPMAVFRKDYPESGKFVNRTLGNDLYEATLNVGELTSLWMRNYKDSTGKQLVVTGSKAHETPMNLIRDSMSVLRFGGQKEDMEVTTIDFNMDLKARWESIMLFIEPVIAVYGLSIDRFKSVPASGVSLRIQNEPLINEIESQYAFYREGEKELANIIRKENNTFIKGVEAIPDDYELYLNFGALPFEGEPTEKWDIYKDMATKGLLSWADIYTIMNPDTDKIDEAQDEIKRNLALNRDLAQSFGNTPGELPLVVEPDDESEELEEDITNPLLEGEDDS